MAEAILVGGGGSSGVVHVGATAPDDKTLLWIDTNATTGGLKYYNESTSKWEHVPVAYTT